MTKALPAKQAAGIKKVRSRKIRNLLLQDSEIPLKIDKQNKVDTFDSIDTNFLGQLLQSQKEQISMLTDEISSKNVIITELLQTIKILNENSHLDSARNHTDCDKSVTNKCTQVESRPEQRVVDVSKNSWVRDDVSISCDMSNDVSVSPNISPNSAWKTEGRRSRVSELKPGKPLILDNRFCGLLVHEPVDSNDFAENEPDTSQLNEYHHEYHHSNIYKRPPVVAPTFPDRGFEFLKKTSPGNSSYAGMVRFGKSVCVVGDSMLGRIRMPEFNRCMSNNLKLNATARKKFFPGAIAKEIGHYILPTLEEQCPDALLIHAGTNNLSKKDFNAKTVADQIIDIARSATERGVNDVFISAIIIRKEFRLQRRANEVNAILQSLASENGYIFIDNSAITLEHVCDDGVHLLESGLTILANNFLVQLAHFLR